MEIVRIEVDNLKCGGCAKTIKNGICELKGVIKVEINPEEHWVEIMHEGAFNLNGILEKLKAMGYPKTGTTEGLEKLGRNIKSYLSCAIGRLEGEDKK